MFIYLHGIYLVLAQCLYTYMAFTWFRFNVYIPTWHLLGFGLEIQKLQQVLS